MPDPGKPGLPQARKTHLEIILYALAFQPVLFAGGIFMIGADMDSMTRAITLMMIVPVGIADFFVAKMLIGRTPFSKVTIGTDGQVKIDPILFLGREIGLKKTFQLSMADTVRIEHVSTKSGHYYNLILNTASMPKQVAVFSSPDKAAAEAFAGLLVENFGVLHDSGAA